MNLGNKRLLEQVRDTVRLKHYSIRTEQAYIYWIKNYIVYNDKKHPCGMGATEIRNYLTWLATYKNVAASTQNQALNAIVFLYKQVLHQDIGDISGAVRAKKPLRIPTVLSRQEIKKIFMCTRENWRVILGLLYGSGMRCMECLRLRIKDIEFDRNHVVVRSGKGNKDRNTMLPQSIKADLKKHLEFVFAQYKKDISDGFATVHLPYALARKYPFAEKEWIWRYVFPSIKMSKDPRTGITQRHHISEDSLNRAIRNAVRLAKIPKKVSSHTFRHSFATHLVEDGVPLHEIQELLGHKNLETTRIYLHIAQSGVCNRTSPFDTLYDNYASQVDKSHAIHTYQ